MWSFTRKPKKSPPADRRVWNEDWKIGDTAECVTDFDGWAEYIKPWERLPKGAHFTVVGFSEGADEGGRKVAYFLVLEGVASAFETTAFRKVRPVSEEKSEVVERILNAKPGTDRVREDAE